MKHFSVLKKHHLEKTVIPKDTSTPVFIAALFVIARAWKQPKCPSVDKWWRRCGTYIQYISSVLSLSCVKLFATWWLQHNRLPSPSLTPGTCTNSCPSSQWCHTTISSSVNPFSSCLQSFPASGSLLRSQFFAWGGQSIGASAPASLLPMNIQDWFPLGWTSWISLQSKGLSRLFSNSTV